MKIWVILIDIFAIYFIIGILCSMVASIKANKDVFREKEVLILTKIILMWSWKYNNLFKQLEK